LILRFALWACVLVGVAGGFAFDADAPRPAEERAGFRVLQGDFHMHTRFSDGVVSPCDLVLLARRRGLDVIGVTEHNSVFPAKIARACASVVAEAPIVVIGEEVTTLNLHLLALGIESDVDARAAPSEIVAKVHAQGGVVVAAHPTRRYHEALSPICDDIDGIEVVHPMAYRGEGGIGRWADIVELARGPCGEGKAMIGNSDYHAGSVLGLVRTYVFVSDVSASGVVEAIRARRAVTFAPDGSAFGPPDLVDALVTEPLAARPTDYAYEARGWLDRISRALGWLGCAGLFVVGFGRRRSELGSPLG
jgi:hypothetical protein